MASGFDEDGKQDAGPPTGMSSASLRRSPIIPTRDDLAWARRFRRLVARRAESICESVERELGKPRFETMASEIIPLLSACRWLERHGRRVLRPRRPLGQSLWQIGQRHRVVRAPLGDVAIIATWNYPVQLLGVQLAQALVAGNRVWVKPSERSPESQALLLDLATEAGMDDDRLRRTGAERAAGTRLLEENRFDHVVFTGSTPVGRAIAQRLGSTLTASTLELSGADSALVFADADVRLAAESIVFALLLNGGQTCMAPRRVFVERDVLGAFVEAVRNACGIKREVTPTDAAELARCRSLCDEAVAAGGAWVHGENGGVPLIVSGCPAETALFLGDHFGPALAVVSVDSRIEALELHSRVEKKLATSVFTSDNAGARALAGRLGSSVVTVNDCIVPTGHPGIGLGGIGPSGWGVTRGAEGLLAMTRPVYVSSTGRRVRTPTDPPSDRAQRGMASVVRRLYG